MKLTISTFFSVIALELALASAVIAQNAEEGLESELKDDNSDARHTEKKLFDDNSRNSKTLARAAPDVNRERISQLQAHYPPEDLVSLQANGAAFSALWKKDQSGDALGAVLIGPSNGQTANWPNTIDVLRNELPVDGWSTLSIDIDHDVSMQNDAAMKISDDQVQTGAKPMLNKHPNLGRIEAAIGFLHEQGQYNIVIVGYGLSTRLVLEYASRTDALGMNRTIKSRQGANLKRPVRALILISPLSYQGEKLSDTLKKFPYKDMPVLDIIFGTHYLDTFDSKDRLRTARGMRFKNYIQTKSVEPTSGEKLFGQENRLSRRIRGFLDRHAKGVEIERR